MSRHTGNKKTMNDFITYSKKLPPRLLDKAKIETLYRAFDDLKLNDKQSLIDKASFRLLTINVRYIKTD